MRENAERTRAEIRAEGGEAAIVLADVSKTDECQEDCGCGD